MKKDTSKKSFTQARRHTTMSRANRLKPILKLLKQTRKANKRIASQQERRPCYTEGDSGWECVRKELKASKLYYIPRPRGRKGRGATGRQGNANSTTSSTERGRKGGEELNCGSS